MDSRFHRTSPEFSAQPGEQRFHAPRNVARSFLDSTLLVNFSP